MEQERIPIIGEKFPNIEADTTHGKISIPGDYRGKWFVFFSHPGDFTPVCTTEFYAFQKRYDYFKELDCELIGLSIDQVFSHIKWIEWIGQNLGQEIKFPIIADDQGRIAKLLNMIHPEKGSNTVRAVFIVDNIGVIRTILYYPQELGRNIDEILRIVKSLQIADQKNLAIPANWPNNEIIGSKGIIHPPKDEKTAKQRLESSKKGEIECKDWWFCYKKVFDESDYDLDTGKSKIKPGVYYLEQKDTEKKEYEKEADKKRETDKDTDRETFDFHKKRDIENPEALDNKDKEPEEKEFRRESYDRIRSEENIQEKYEKTPEENESEIYKGYKKQGLREEPVYELSDVEESSETREVYEINPDRTGDYTFDTKPEIRNNLEETEKIQKDTEETEDKFQTTSEISEKPKEEKEIDDYTKRNSFMSLDKEKLKEDYYEETEDDYDLDEYDETEDEDDEERDRDFYRYKYGLDDDKTKEIGEETFFG